MSTEVIDLVRKTVTVDAPVERAFTVFTERMADWWPLATHSAGKERAESVVLERFAGGRFYEIQSGGEESDWGKVLAWEPPHRVVVTWHPGNTPDVATELEVRFEADGEGTQVVLEHRGWEARGEQAAELRESYDTGWDFVLGRYVAAFGV